MELAQQAELHRSLHTGEQVVLHAQARRLAALPSALSSVWSAGLHHLRWQHSPCSCECIRLTAAAALAPTCRQTKLVPMRP
jgi:hypothetical protein